MVLMPSWFFHLEIEVASDEEVCGVVSVQQFQCPIAQVTTILRTFGPERWWNNFLPNFSFQMVDPIFLTKRSISLTRWSGRPLSWVWRRASPGRPCSAAPPSLSRKICTATTRLRYLSECRLYMSHSQMLGKVEYGLPAKIWRLVGCTEMLSR